MHFYPDSLGARLLEHNDCHSKQDGKFCSGPAGTTLRVVDDPRHLTDFLSDYADSPDRLPKGLALIRASANGVEAGYLALVYPDPAKRGLKEYAEVYDVSVTHALRGKGVASSLYKEAIKVAQAHGFRGIASNRNTRNEASERIWEEWLKSGVAKHIGNRDVREFNSEAVPPRRRPGG